MSEPTAGELVAGKYRLERLVGRGGMGTVWAGRHEQLGMLVALKFINHPAARPRAGGDQSDARPRAGGDHSHARPRAGVDHSHARSAHDDEARARFEREARTAAQIRSPHVAQIFDHGVDGDRHYIAMELLEGEDLGARLRREGHLAPMAVARILTQAAKALRRAHEAGVIHRDLKPGNIFLARFDDDEVVKLLDFGVAKVVTEGALEGAFQTQIGMVFGSPAYMSPEQARGVRALDHRTDLWSLAVIAFRALTGVKPFQGATIADLVVKLCIDPLPIPSASAPHLPPEIDQFFARAFARDIEQRFTSASELAAAFEVAAAAASLPALPPPPSSGRAPWLGIRPAAPPPPSSRPPPGIGGSGPQLAFAPGTLTPPPDAALLSGPPLGSSPAAVELPRDGAVSSLTRPPSPASPSWRVIAFAAVAFACLLAGGAAVLAASARAKPAALASDPSPEAAREVPPPSVEAPSPAAPSPSAAGPEADRAATEAPLPPAASSSSAPAATAKPRTPMKPGKKRPNFGY